MQRRVVVTGIGLLTPIGSTKEEFFTSLKEGKSGIDAITRFDTEGFPVRIAGEVKDFKPEDYMSKKEAKRMDRYTQYAMAASKMAMEDSMIDVDKIDKDKFGVILGCGIGGLSTLEEQYQIYAERGPKRISPFFIPMMIANMAAGQIAIEYGAQGINETVVTACASSTNAMGDSFRAVQRGEVDLIITGGTEAPITPMSLGGFAALKALSSNNENPKEASRPFDAKRDGFVMGEGAGILILEELEHAKARGAKIYAEMVGYGVTCDANHITMPAEGGIGAVKAMTKALADAGAKPEDIDYINAHGTSTEYNDKFETAAIKTVFGDHAYDGLKVSSTKSMTGHLLGAAGGVEGCICALAIERSFIPPTINYEFKDECCDLDYVPNVGIDQQVNYAMSNSLGFGGHNATVIFKKYE